MDNYLNLVLRVLNPIRLVFIGDFLIKNKKIPSTLL